MSFTVAADSYDRFMGRYSSRLAPVFAGFVGVKDGQRALDVGCGPGALLTELVERLGAASVAAADPSEPFAAAARERHPDVDVRQAAAEELPFGADAFDVTLAQLVVHFMTDPRLGLAEMARVTRRGGVVAACVWDLAGDRAPLSPFWRAARELDRDVEDESRLMGASGGDLGGLFEQAGLREIEEAELAIEVEHASFEEWWQPFTLGVGPAGAYAVRLEPDRLAELRERCRALIPSAPFTLRSVAWAARGRAG